MTEPNAAEPILALSGQVLDQICAVLAKVGIDLPPLVLQLFLLAIVVAMFVPTWKKLRARTKSDRVPLYAAIALGLVGLGILVGVVENATTPARVVGSLRSDRLADVRVVLIDFRDREISRDAGRVDTATGRFALHYAPLVDGRARKLRIVAPGCKPQDFDLSRAALRAQSEINWEHVCAPA
jgi:hypothetical protein